jgi:hypothetical protein
MNFVKVAKKFFFFLKIASQQKTLKYNVKKKKKKIFLVQISENNWENIEKINGYRYLLLHVQGGG